MRTSVAVFGAGVSGRAAVRLAEAEGASTRVFDEAGQGDSAVFGAADAERFDVFVFSPGFAQEHPWRRLAEGTGKPCYGELGYAAERWRGTLYGVTGTNGKSTLTGLIDAAFRAAGYGSVAAGNIGRPLSEVVLSETNRPESIAVCEISSFQAELTRGLRLDGLLWTNFAEDHLDRYPSMKAYFNTKTQLFACLKSDAVCVVGPQVAEWMNLLHKEFDACTMAYDDPDIIARLDRRSPFLRYPYSENFAVAAEFWWLMRLSPSALLESANRFKLAAHRLDMAMEWGGVRFWNDSKATNFHATLAALDATEGAVYWIGGGQLKGGDVEAFAKQASERITAAYVYGEIGERLEAALAPHVSCVERHARCEDAIRAAAAAALAAAPASVLFSPGFSSFDQFSSYAERGKCFISTVLSLKREASEG